MELGKTPPFPTQQSIKRQRNFNVLVEAGKEDQTGQITSKAYATISEHYETQGDFDKTLEEYVKKIEN